MKNLGDALLRIRADDEATHPRPIGELSIGIGRAFGGAAVAPFVFLLRLHVVVPTAPIVPGDEQSAGRPLRAFGEVTDAVGGPLLAELHGGFTGIGTKGRVFALKAGRINPGHAWEVAGGGVGIELRPGDNVGTALERGNVVEIVIGFVAVTTPGEIGSL